MKRLVLSTALAASLASPAARAEESKEPVEGTPAVQAGSPNRTVVTPSRRESTTFDTAGQVHVLDKDELRFDQPFDVPEALQSLPGVMLQRTNRGAGAPVLRGLIGPENLLLIDGVRLNTSIYRTGPNQYAALIDPMALQAVEVVLGPGSVLYGTDAMGGTINHLTLAVPRDGWGVGVDVTGASVDLGFGASLLAELATDDVSGWVRGGYRRRDELVVGGGGTVPLSGYDQTDWGTKVRLRLGSEWSLTAALLGSYLQDAGRVDNLGRGDVRFSDNLDNLTYLRLQRMGGGLLRRFSGTLSLHNVAEREDRRRCNTLDGGAVADRAGCIADAAGAVKSHEAREDGVMGFGATVEAGLGLLDWLDLDVGAELRNEWISSERVDDPSKRGNFSDGSTFGTVDGWMWLEARVLWPEYELAPAGLPGLEPTAHDQKVRVKLAGGVRGTGVFASAPDVPGLGDVEYDYAGLVGAARASMLIGRGLHLWTGFSQGFRAPNLQETTVLGDTGQTFEVPNPDLGPQRNDTLEAGLRMHSSKANFTLVGFATDVTDAIVRGPATYEGQSQVDGKDVVRRINASSTEYVGLEATLGVGPFEGLSFEGMIGWLDGTLTEQDGDETAPRRLPPLQGKVAVRWQGDWKRLRVEGGVRFSAAQRRLAAEDERDLRICGNADGTALLDDCQGTDGWSSVYLGAAMEPTEQMELRLRAENLLDARYRVHGSGFEAPGLGVELGLGYRFD